MTGREPLQATGSDPAKEPDMMTDAQPVAGPESAVRDVVPGGFLRTVAAAAPWPVGVIVSGAACLVAQSGAEWLSGALILVWFLVLDRGLGLPTRAWIPRVIRWLLPVSALVAAGGLLAGRARSGDWMSSTVIVEGVVVLAISAVAVWSRGRYRGVPDAPAMTFPLQQGTWFAIEGEGRVLNHHWRAPAQRAALDLVRLGGNGMSHRGVHPGRTGMFFAYGTPVFSPCDGVVVAGRDGDDDMRTPGSHPAGNHVVIETSGVRVLLGHFASGSVLVVNGQRVYAGQPLARVGNSGNSSEPHLHIHAQRDGKPLRLRFIGRHRRIPRGTTITT